MDLPATDVEVKPEKFEEVKEAGPMFHCGLFDAEIVHKIAQAFLPGLGSACVDNTTGGLFKSPASVAVDIRKEMVDYLTQRSETFVAESVILEGGPEAEVSDNPFDIISNFVDDFVSSKRNIFSRVSGWLLSDRREDRIDDFVQEMEINGFWFMERREAIAQTLLKNVDFKNLFHCNMKFNHAEELAEHDLQCNFRTIDCTNEGCNARFCAAHLENHDSICLFKILPCEQKCSERIMRREMDKHCITICPMKLVNCPFYQVGCQSSVPQSSIEQHRLENVQSHSLYILQVIHKDASVEDLKKRVEQLEELAAPGRLAAARDVRSLTFAIKDLEAKLGPLQVNTNIKVRNCEDSTESPNKKEECVVSPSKKEESTEHNESPPKKEECAELPTKESLGSPPKKVEYINPVTIECTESATEKEECVKSPEKSAESPTKTKDNSEESPTEKSANSSTTTEDNPESPTEKSANSPTKTKDNPESPNEKSANSPTKTEDNPESPNEKSANSSTTTEGNPESPTEKNANSPTKTENNPESPNEKSANSSTTTEGNPESPTEKSADKSLET